MLGFVPGGALPYRQWHFTRPGTRSVPGTTILQGPEAELEVQAV